MTWTTTRTTRIASGALLLAGLLVAGGCRGVEPDASAAAVEKPGPAASASETPADTGGAADERFPDRWYYYNARNPAIVNLRRLEGRPAPPLRVKSWVGEPQDLAGLRGRVVVLDFWATWCPPCVKALPKNVKLVEQYGDQGLTVIGVHDAGRGWEHMGHVAKANRINYPLAIDDGGASTRAWKVRLWPTYAVIDRNGIVRGAGLQPEYLEEAVKRLLEEP